MTASERLRSRMPLCQVLLGIVMRICHEFHELN